MEFVKVVLTGDALFSLEHIRKVKAMAGQEGNNEERGKNNKVRISSCV